MQQSQCFQTHNGQFFQMIAPHIKGMGRFVDIGFEVKQDWKEGKSTTDGKETSTTPEFLTLLWC